MISSLIKPKKNLWTRKLKQIIYFQWAMAYWCMENGWSYPVLTKKILKDFHTGHPGMSRMRALMRSYVCWLGMDKNIENMAKSCKRCVMVAKAPPIKFNPWPKTDKPWFPLHIDYASSIKGTFFFFVIVGGFTKWPEVFKCKTPTTKTTIKVLQELFARFWLLETTVSDNGTPFKSKEFENFWKLLSINLLKSAPYHPRSNGFCGKIYWCI